MSPAGDSPRTKEKQEADWFTGDGWWDVIVAGQEPSRMRVNLVRCAPGARTNWHAHAHAHAHALGQSLRIVSGIAMWEGSGDGAPRPSGPNR
ncbi:hypothetical protein [Streptomyces sp. NBC_01451]|uniref:hypothetical protein n=1 Tax=Streptomyces sp. NBC_01451 TaxID=2903872 RepID=UPI002E32C2B3|nr:hypothetical protein [Streptomyces sp. NBC_01451]